MDHIRETQEIIDVHQGGTPPYEDCYEELRVCLCLVSVDDCFQFCIGNSKTQHST